MLALGLSSTLSSARFASPVMCEPAGPRPSLCVLDLDMCVWSPEMYLLGEMPDRPIIGDLNGRGEGVIGVHSGPDVIKLFPGALAALQECADGLHGDMKLAVASSADTPRAEKIGRAAMQILEILPGLTMYELLTRDFEDGRNLQIGRQPPLSSNKAQTHFPILLRETGIPYDEMVFFDDCGWGDHCANVEKNCKGVVTQRTPRGLTVVEWRNALRKFAAAKSSS
jgi:magnesium-dependent phosphatase 1